MKRVSTGLLLTGLAALSACGGGASTANKASNVVANDVYVVPDDLGNDVLLNDSGLNALGPTNAVAPGNNAATNTTGNSL
jgi:hypothetical protein